MQMPTLRQLRYLTALAEERHFGRAAAACHVTQPALSMQIRELEAELDLVLVERGRGASVLTPDGAALAERARALIAGVKDLEDFARERRGVGSRRLALGMIPSVAPYLLPRAAPVLQAALPGLELKVRETQTATLLSELAAGELDAVIAAAPLAGEGIETVALFVRHYLTLALPVPEHQQEALRAQGRARYAQFIEQLARHIQRGRSLVREVHQEIGPEFTAPQEGDGDPLSAVGGAIPGGDPSSTREGDKP